MVEALPEDVITGPTVSVELDGISQRQSFQVATIKPGEKTGHPRTETLRFSDYGQPRDIAVEYIDVWIPFDGNATSFELMPSRSVMIGEEIEVTSGRLVIPLRDDDRLETTLDNLVNHIKMNLDQLRVDLADLPQRIRQALDAPANSRRDAILARRSRDRGRGFPIIR